MAAPLISCILLTRDCPAFAAQAAWYFLRQDYPNKELIVVDDGANAAGTALPKDERLCYLHLPQPTSIAEKWNIGVQISRGSWLAEWNETAWIGPQRLTRQWETLAATGAKVCTLNNHWCYCLDHGQAWFYRRQPAFQSKLHQEACTIFSRDLLEEFAENYNQRLQDNLSPEKVCSVSGEAFYCTIMFAGDYGLINPADPAWERRQVASIADMMGYDSEFYVKLRGGNYSTPATPSPRINLVAPFFVYDGLGSMAEYLALGLARAGVDLDIFPFRLDLNGTSRELQEMVAASKPDPFAPTLALGWVGENFEILNPRGPLFINTMWETDRLPPGYLPKLNRATALIVPTCAVANIFKASGITKPVEVVKQGVDPEVYHFLDRPEREGLVTLMVGSFTKRKNFETGIAAWKKAFKDDKNARLIIKARFGYHNFQPDDARICFINSEEPTRGIPHWYHKADVLMALGNEGFGLPLVEGMATGLPVIALDSEGQSDMCRDAGQLLLAVKPERFEPVNEPPFDEWGVRGIPPVEKVAGHLQWIAAHREEARQMGQAASKWVLKNRNVWEMGPKMLEVMETYMKNSRPLGRKFYVWVGSGPSPGATYGKELARQIPGLEVSPNPPDLGRVRVLHVQYEPEAFDDDNLLRYLQAARFSGIGVIVTNHSAKAPTRVWEREAQALAALTPEEVGCLKARWPQKIVELLPGEGEEWPNLAARHLALWRVLERN